MEKASSFHGSRVDMTDNDAIDEDKHKKLAKIHEKMKKIMDRISLEQKRKEENVNTYLKASSLVAPNVAAASQSVRAKNEFEKRNQKCTQIIDSSQRKFEEYKKKASEIERMTPAQYAELSSSTTNTFPRDTNALRSRKNVLHGLKGVGVGIKEGISGGLSTGLRAKEYVSQLLLQKNSARSTSADNLDRINDRVTLEEVNRQCPPASNTLPARFDQSFKYASDEEDDNLSSLTGSGSQGPTSTAPGGLCKSAEYGGLGTGPAVSSELSPQHRRRHNQQHQQPRQATSAGRKDSRQPRSRGDPAADDLSADEEDFSVGGGVKEDSNQRHATTSDPMGAPATSSASAGCRRQKPASLRSVDIATNQKIMDLNNIVDSLIAENLEIRGALQEYKDQHQIEVTSQRRKIEDINFTTTILDEQCNNIMELRKADLDNYAQTIEGIEEKLFYQTNERHQDLQDALDNTQTRITKMEMQLQQQRVNLIEGFETATNIRNLLTKIANVLLSLITLVCVLISTVSATFLPFVSTRIRVFVTLMILVLCYLIYYWKNTTIDAVYSLLYSS